METVTLNHVIDAIPTALETSAIGAIAFIILAGFMLILRNLLTAVITQTREVHQRQKEDAVRMDAIYNHFTDYLTSDASKTIDIGRLIAEALDKHAETTTGEHREILNAIREEDRDK